MSTRPTRRAAAMRKRIVEEDSNDEINGSSSPAEEEEEEDSEDDFTPAPAKSVSRRSVVRSSVARSRKQSTQPPASQTETPPPASSRARKPGRPKKNATRESATVEPSQVDGEQEPASTNATATRKRGRPRKNVVKEESIEPEAISATIAERSVQPTIEAEDAEVIREQTAATNDTAMDIDDEPPAKKAPGRKRKTAPPSGPTPAKSPTPAQIIPALDLQPPASADPQATPRASNTPAPDRFQTPVAENDEDRQQDIDDMLLNTARPIKPLDTIMDKPMDILLKSRTMTIPQVEDTTPKPRLVITYLILTNFKSYAGRQEVGPFHASFSSVVGPNGSGKSNVIDSLLFVFGFRASKMRQGKLSALIHNSAQYPNLDHCEVAVHFHEVLDQVRLFTLTIHFLILTFIISPEVDTKSYPILSSTFLAKLSRTTRAATTSTARRPTLQRSRRCSKIAGWILTTSDS